MLRVGNSLRHVAAFITILGALQSPPALGDAQAVTPLGEFAQIDTRLADAAIQLLSEGTSEEKREIVARIRARPEDYAPPVFYVLSNMLFAGGEKEEGAFWFYAGQLRARIDANICADSSAQEAVGALNMLYGAPINQYTFQDIQKLEELVLKVLDWERRTPYNYDRRWINLFGMAAFTTLLGAEDGTSAQTSLSYPEAQWKEIAENTRVEYLIDFHDVVRSMEDEDDQ